VTDIEFKPHIRWSTPTWRLWYGVEAFRKSRDARRKVFASASGKSHIWVYGSLTRVTSAEAEAAAQHLADVLNKWITEHNEEELNILVLLIQKGTTANLTDAENKLLAHYLLNGGEPF